MRHLKILFLTLLLLFLTVAAWSLSNRLPMPPTGLASEKYEGFSGVLQIWIGENVADDLGSVQSWINKQAAVFEKNNSGVYIRLNAVPIEQLAAASHAVQPPDMILFCPGDVPAAGLLALEEAELSPAFRNAGSSGGATLARPVAAGGYVLAAAGTLPESLSELPESSVGAPEGMEPALVALCERYAVQRKSERTIAAPDIGLLTSATPEPTLAPVEGTSLRAENLRADTLANLYSALLSGEISATPLTQRQVARIRAAQADGKYGDIQFLNAAGYTDQLLMAAIVDTKRDDLPARSTLCAAFIDQLLTDEAQAGLSSCALFPTALTGTLYDSVGGMSQIEAALRRSDCVVRGAFDPPVSVNFSGFLSGEVSARELMRGLRNES